MNEEIVPAPFEKPVVGRTSCAVVVAETQLRRLVRVRRTLRRVLDEAAALCGEEIEPMATLQLSSRQAIEFMRDAAGVAALRAGAAAKRAEALRARAEADTLDRQADLRCVQIGEKYTPPQTVTDPTTHGLWRYDEASGDIVADEPDAPCAPGRP